MIDWEEVIKAESTEELKEIKLWLFQENMRLKQERSELEQERTELEQARNKFLDERVKLRYNHGTETAEGRESVF